MKKLIQEKLVIEVMACEHAEESSRDRGLEVWQPVELVDHTAHPEGEPAQPAVDSRAADGMHKSHDAETLV